MRGRLFRGYALRFPIGVKVVGFLAGSILMSRTIIMPIISLVEHFKSKSGGIVLSVPYCFVMSAPSQQG